MAETPLRESAKAKRVLLIITGGTICMRPAATTESGLIMTELSCSPMETMLRELPVLKDPSLPAFDLLEWDELVDSSDIEGVHWSRLANQIAERYADFDGFVILHGTDTLAFTASALSFMFEPETLRKTVVITGSMLPITHINTDALRNITVSMLVAAYSQLNDVVVCFGSRVLKGCRVTKTNCNIMDAFDTPNVPHLGQVGIEITMNDLPVQLRGGQADDALPASVEVFTNLMTTHVCVLRVTPAFDPLILRQLAVADRSPLGVVLQLYGTGTAPSNEKFLKAIQFAINTGVTVVAVTQCQSGTCSLKSYANGLKLHQLGVIEGKDLTTEAAFVKLAYLFGKGFRGDDLRELMEADLRGELCESTHCITGQGTMEPLELSPSNLVEENKHFKRSVQPSR